jgi:hypothetical protein
VAVASLQRLVHYRRGRRGFGVTLVAWNENAAEKYSESSTAIA